MKANQKATTKEASKMKTKLTNLFVKSALAGLVAAAMAFGSAIAAQAAGEIQAPARTIQGAWQTMVTPVNCTTGDPLAPPFPGLFTFNRGGTLSEYGISPGMSPALRSPGHGIWQHVGGLNFSVIFTFNRYDATGLFIGTQKVTAALVLGASNNDFTTTSAIEIFDVNGNLIGTGCATAAGTRFK